MTLSTQRYEVIAKNWRKEIVDVPADPTNKYSMPSKTTKYHPLPDTTHVVEVVVDLDKLGQRLGLSAVKNKSKRAVYMNGAVIVREVRP